MSSNILPIIRSSESDRVAIRYLAARFANAVNSRDADEFKSLWLSDGVWEIKPPMTIVVEGREAIAHTFTELLAGWEFFVQMLHSGIVEVKENQAIARWCMEEIGRSTTGKGFHNYGLYEDKLLYTGENWYFASRIYHYFYLEEPVLTGTAFPLPILKNLADLC